jgi:hypothetical protein
MNTKNSPSVEKPKFSRNLTKRSTHRGTLEYAQGYSGVITGVLWITHSQGYSGVLGEPDEERC